MDVGCWMLDVSSTSQRLAKDVGSRLPVNPSGERQPDRLCPYHTGLIGRIESTSFKGQSARRKTSNTHPNNAF